MKPLALAALVLSTFAVACAGSADAEVSGSSDQSALASSDGSYCQDAFAKWRADQDRLGKITGVTDAERADLVAGSWDVATLLAMSCVKLKQTSAIPADVVAHSLANAQKDCDANRAAIEKRIANIDTLADATDAEKDQFRAMEQRELAAAQQKCSDDLAFFRALQH
jgi:hypothetical protein